MPRTSGEARVDEASLSRRTIAAIAADDRSLPADGATIVRGATGWVAAPAVSLTSHGHGSTCADEGLSNSASKARRAEFSVV
jgi:hypothetical protein